MQVQELVGIVPWTFIAQICNLFLQVYLIKRFLFKPINEVLAKRKAMADAQLQDAAKAKDEAKEQSQRNSHQCSEECFHPERGDLKAGECSGRCHQGEGGERYCPGKEKSSERDQG